MGMRLEGVAIFPMLPFFNWLRLGYLDKYNVIIFLMYRMYESEMEFCTPHRSYLVLLWVTVQSSVRQEHFQCLVCLASLPHRERDLIKCSRSDSRQTLPPGFSNIAITTGDCSKINYWRK